MEAGIEAETKRQQGKESGNYSILITKLFLFKLYLLLFKRNKKIIFLSLISESLQLKNLKLIIFLSINFESL